MQQNVQRLSPKVHSTLCFILIIIIAGAVAGNLRLYWGENYCPTATMNMHNATMPTINKKYHTIYAYSFANYNRKVLTIVNTGSSTSTFTIRPYLDGSTLILFITYKYSYILCFGAK